MQHFGQVFDQGFVQSLEDLQGLQDLQDLQDPQDQTLLPRGEGINWTSGIVFVGFCNPRAP